MTNDFSASYAEARQRFLDAAEQAGARLTRLPLRATGPEGLPLSIDIARFGSRTPRKLLIHSSGIHGVEGFAGSAIQRALLNNLPRPPEETALILVHILNPYGMAWLRRTNESNVDLNRNFLGPEESWSGAPEIYPLLSPFLNPPRPPSREWFLLKAFWRILRHGFANMKQAIAAGQYDLPEGLFYGGNRPEEGPRRYRDWLAETFQTADEVFVIDVHTGLGPAAVGSLLLRAEGTDRARLEQTISRPLLDETTAQAVVGYPIRGSLSNLYREHFGAEKVTFLTQEFGTVSNLKVLKALRAENQHHHYGEGGIDHWSKQELKEAFSPGDPDWQSQVLAQGVHLFKEAGEYLFRRASEPKK